MSAIQNGNNNASVNSFVSLDERYELIGERCTLDGFSAIIQGTKSEFATVTTLTGSRIAAEFAWSTVRNIVRNKHAAFKSR